MITLLTAGVALLLLWWLSQQFVRSNPASLARVIKLGGGLAAFGGAGLLLLRGRFDMAVALAAVGAWLLGWSRWPLAGFGRTAAAPRSGATSRVRSAMIEMQLDHDSGALHGTVLAGPLAGRSLDSLSEAELSRLHAACAGADPDGLRLLEAYLDRRSPGWREHAEADSHPRPGVEAAAAAMTEEEAYQILGLQPGADAEAIRQAHRALMKKLHPDQGGSTYLATRVNQAKDRLLGRHR